MCKGWAPRWDVMIRGLIIAVILVAVVVGIYSVVVFGLGLIFGMDQVDFDMQVAAAVLVAVSFYPARRRAAKLANRLVYGLRATPYEVLARFSHGAADTADEQLLGRIPRLVVDGTGAMAATLWVRSGDAFDAVASFPEDTARNAISSEEGFEDREADHSVAIHHGDEALGGLSLVRARGESMPPAEAQLLADLAAGLGVVLRNHALTAELRQQVEALGASRDRVVAAADEARRVLERDLDSGPQQRLVALKVMLGPIRKQAEEAGAVKTAQILGQLESESGEAIRAVREFAGGIYPPLLEAEGVVAAITQQAQHAPFPVTVDARDVGRHPSEVEAAVYFTILEALQNAAKYADPTGATVSLDEHGDKLEFRVTDDGIGFDPSEVSGGAGLSNMADRIDSVGGEFRVVSSPGSGTTVEGSIPVGGPAAD